MLGKIVRYSSSFTVSKRSLNCPWTESPFFKQLLNQETCSQTFKEQAEQFNEEGYIIIDTKISKNDCNKIHDDVIQILNSSEKTVQSRHFQYTDKSRLFEGWRQSSNIKNLILNKEIMNMLKFLYDKEPIPFSSINFTHGSNQPLHSDAIHFHTIPYKWMTGVWVALEDTNCDNGTLQIVPKSHKWDIYDYNDLMLEHCDNIKNGEEHNYRIYEDFIRELIRANNGELISVNLKQGQALIWAANLLHGGMEIRNTNLTRKTQAIHYFYKDCEQYFHPMFSKPFKGQYAKKWCDDKTNILTVD